MSIHHHHHQAEHKKRKKKEKENFPSCTVHLDTIKVFLPTDAQQSCFKRILKFTLKQPLHVSVQSPS
jgi:hypothetical protein